MCDIKWIKSQKGNNIPVINGHRFKRNRSKGDKIFWKCERKGCRTNAITISGLLTSQTGSHSHCLRTAPTTATSATTTATPKRRTQSKKATKANATTVASTSSAPSSLNVVIEPQSYLQIAEGNRSEVEGAAASFPSATTTTTTVVTTAELSNVENVETQQEQEPFIAAGGNVGGIWLKAIDGRRFLIMENRESNLN